MTESHKDREKGEKRLMRRLFWSGGKDERILSTDLRGKLK